MARKPRMSVWGTELSSSLWHDLQSEQGKIRTDTFRNHLYPPAAAHAAKAFFAQGVRPPARAKELAVAALSRLAEVLALRAFRNPQDLSTELDGIVETLMKEQRHLAVQVNQAGEETRG